VTQAAYGLAASEIAIPTQTSPAAAPADPDPANSLIVAAAWLRSIPGLENIVAGTLPDPAKWMSTGFVTVTTGAGGSTHPYYPERTPVMTAHGWATAAPGSKRVLKAKAVGLLERVVAATYRTPPDIELGAQFKPVFIEFVVPAFEILEVPEPQSNYAHYALDFRIGWIEQQPVG